MGKACPIRPSIPGPYLEAPGRKRERVRAHEDLNQMDIIELLDQPEPEQEKALPPISARALLTTVLIVVVVGAVLWGWVARDSRAWDASKSQYEEAIAVAEAKQEQDVTAAVQEVEEALQVLEQEAHHSTKLLKQVGDELDDLQASADLD